MSSFHETQSHSYWTSMHAPAPVSRRSRPLLGTTILGNKFPPSEMRTQKLREVKCAQTWPQVYPTPDAGGTLPWKTGPGREGLASSPNPTTRRTAFHWAPVSSSSSMHRIMEASKRHDVSSRPWQSTCSIFKTCGYYSLLHRNFSKRQKGMECQVKMATQQSRNQVGYAQNQKGNFLTWTTFKTKIFHVMLFFLLYFENALEKKIMCLPVQNDNYIPMALKTQEINLTGFCRKPTILCL